MTGDQALERLLEKYRERLERCERRIAEDGPAQLPWERGLRAGTELAIEDVETLQSIVAMTNGRPMQGVAYRVDSEGRTRNVYTGEEVEL